MTMFYFDFLMQENSQYQRTYVTRNGLVFNCLAGAYFMSIISTACTSKLLKFISKMFGGGKGVKNVQNSVHMVYGCPLTAASFFTSSSDAPKEAKPISWLNWAKFESANIGMWPRISCTQSLDIEEGKLCRGRYKKSKIVKKKFFFFLLFKKFSVRQGWN